MIRLIPLLLIVIIAYNVIVSFTQVSIGATVFAITLPSNAAWTMTVGGLDSCCSISKS